MEPTEQSNTAEKNAINFLIQRSPKIASYRLHQLDDSSTDLERKQALGCFSSSLIKQLFKNAEEHLPFAQVLDLLKAF